jgi:ABC-type branched-subunit amino acid transport system substrate-binding protein
VVGGLFSLTGGWSTLGQSSKAALEIAVEDVNAYLSRVNARIRFDFLIEDTQLIPELALEKLQLLDNKKVHCQFGNFDFWAVGEAGNSLQWIRVAHYNTATKEIVRGEP